LPTFKTTMMEHQKQAVEKLRKVKVSAIYADMGTGKTRMALELAIRRIRAGKVDCVLWCCPVSVKQTIANEVEKHTDCSYEMLQPKQTPGPADIYIAGIESLSSSISLNARMIELVESRRCFVVCDESSLIKNHRANRTLAMWRLGERSDYKLILNGTPVSNNEQDLFAQWYFLDHRILGYTSYYSFQANHLEMDPDHPGRVIRAHNVDLLVRKMQPYVYQIRKDECLDLPPKNYSTRWYKMSTRQRWCYDDTKSELLLNVEFADWESYAIFRLFSGLQKVVGGLTLDNKHIFRDPKNNPRVKLLLETIDDIPDDAKVIIWCKYTHEIESLADVLSEYGVAKLYGELTPSQRNEELERFRKTDRFLVANKRCGSFGLNLQFCNYAIYYDNDFSWETRQQSEDRIHRVGQNKNCHIIDVVCEESIDTRIQSCLEDKGSLIDSFRKTIDAMKDKETLARWIDGAEDIPGAKRVRRSNRTA
jgi:SNF2 family DNA or RNA helicase